MVWMSAAVDKRVGPWVLGEQLGRGGNATVWAARHHDNDSRVALKIINARNVGREPYQRFVREIMFLRAHHDVSGLLPLIDAHLPDKPTRADPPWLAMPVATPIANALRCGGLAEVVRAVAAIADTLDRLQRDTGIAHRDIKPGNLYELDGDWLIGDFGLISLPDAAGLTVEGKPVGPAHYTAYEMIRDPASADPHPADVYSLGKTLWVLATDQRFPPEGHQPAGTRGFGVGDFRPHPHASALDRAIDLMTRPHPESRPSKDQVARDLAAWLDLAGQPVELDLSDLRAKMNAKLSGAIAQQDTSEQQKDLALAAVRRLQELTAPLNRALKDLSPRTQIDVATDKMTANLLTSHHGWGSPAVEFRWHRCTVVSPLDGPIPTILRMGRSVELLDGGLLALHLMVHVGPDGVMATSYNWHRPVTSAPVGTIEAEKMIEDGVRDLAEALRAGIEVLVEESPELDR